MVNTQLLDQKIKDSGLKINYIASELGITPQALQNKRSGRSAFKKLERDRLCELVNISEAEMPSIFAPFD